MAKKWKEEWKIYKNVFDQFTIRSLEELRNKHHINKVVSPVMTGKESNVFLAESPEGIVIVKIYRLQSCNFNTMFSYIKSDPRFMEIKNRRRVVILKWVEREFKNLHIANKHINVPEPLALENNIVVMESIGDNRPAPQLKDALPQDMEEFRDSILEQYMKLVEHELIHADLSEFNILNHEEVPYFIDFSQATDLMDPRAVEYAERDLNNIKRFFTKYKVDVDVQKPLQSVVKLIEKKRKV